MIDTLRNRILIRVEGNDSVCHGHSRAEVVGKNWAQNGGVLNCEQCPEHAENSTRPSRRKWPLKPSRSNARTQNLLRNLKSIPTDVKAQCDLLGLPRSTFCYRPFAASEQDLVAMRTRDELYQENPTRGTRRMSNERQKRGLNIGRDRTRRLMQRRRMKTIYCRLLHGRN